MDFTGAVNLALAGTGVVALVISALTLKEMQAQRRAQLRPVIFIGTVAREDEDGPLRREGTFIRLDEGPCYDSLDYPLYVYLRNVGTGPALEVVLDSFGRFPFYFTDKEEGHWFALAPSEAVLFEIRVQHSGEVQFGTTPITVRFRYSDSAGTPYQAEAKIRVLHTLDGNGMKCRISVIERHHAIQKA